MSVRAHPFSTEYVLRGSLNWNLNFGFEVYLVKKTNFIMRFLSSICSAQPKLML